MRAAKKALAKPSATASQSLTDAVYESLLEGILSGALAAGTVLSALELADKLKVSRTPIHHALRALAADGFVELQNGRRARVVRFTRDDCWEIFEMRRFLEGPAAELAAGKMDDRQLAPLRKGAEQLAGAKGAIDWTERWSEYDEAFHRAIAEASGNRRLAHDIGRYRRLHRTFNRRATDPKSLYEALTEHLEILAALERRDGLAARLLMEQHIRKWQRYFVESCGV